MAEINCNACSKEIHTTIDRYYTKNRNYYCHDCFKCFIEDLEETNMKDVNFKFEFNVDEKLQEILSSDEWQKGIFAFIESANDIKKIKTDIRAIKKELKRNASSKM